MQKYSDSFLSRHAVNTPLTTELCVCVLRLRVLRWISAVVRGVFRLRRHLWLPHRSRSWSQQPGLVRQQRPTHDGHRQSNGMRRYR